MLAVKETIWGGRRLGRLAPSLRQLAGPSCGCEEQVAHPDQVVDGQRKGEHPINLGDATMTSFAQAPDGLEPAVDLFDSFALLLTNGVARMAGGARIDDGGRLARDVAASPDARAVPRQTPCGHSPCQLPESPG